MAHDRRTGLIRTFSPPLLLTLMGLALIGSGIAWLQYGQPILGQVLWGAAALAGVLAAVRAIGSRNWNAAWRAQPID